MADQCACRRRKTFSRQIYAEVRTRSDSQLLQRAKTRLALSGHIEASVRLSAIWGEADMARAAGSSARWPAISPRTWRWRTLYSVGTEPFFLRRIRRFRQMVSSIGLCLATLTKQARNRDHDSSDEREQARKQHNVTQERTHTRASPSSPLCGAILASRNSAGNELGACPGGHLVLFIRRRRVEPTL
jgi:hypothetical protein